MTDGQFPGCIEFADLGKTVRVKSEKVAIEGPLSEYRVWTDTALRLVPTEPQPASGEEPTTPTVRDETTTWLDVVVGGISVTLRADRDSIEFVEAE